MQLPAVVGVGDGVAVGVATAAGVGVAATLPEAFPAGPERFGWVSRPSPQAERVRARGRASRARLARVD